MPPEAAIAPAAPAAPASPSAPRTPVITPASLASSASGNRPATDPGPQPDPPKKGSARDQMFQKLRQKAGQPDAPAAPTAEPAAAPAEPAEGAEPGGEGQDRPGLGEQPAAAPEAIDKKKVSPWKLVDEHKAARLKAETELVELRKQMADPKVFEETKQKLDQISKRNKELEDHMSFVDYSQSQEFADKYKKPYTDAWQRWMNDLGELQIMDPSTGQERPVSANDLVELVNLPLQKAREKAEETFGNFADDVMSARKEIKGLFDSQSRALDEAKKMGAERIAQHQKMFQEQQQTVIKEMSEVWKAANESAQKDPKWSKFFTPKDGDEEGNKRLTSGYEMADRAFQVNPNDPKLSSAERAEIVQLHAAVRNRSAAFGRLAYHNQQLEAKIEALTKEINSYKGAEPGTQPARPTGSSVTGTSARERVFNALRQKAGA